MGQTLVRVRDKSVDEHGHPTELNGTVRTMTYKAFLLTEDNFELLAQVDDSGNEIPGSPNLSAGHKQQAQKNAVHAVSVPVIQKPVVDIVVSPSVAEPQQTTLQNVSHETPKKRGRKPKEVIEHSA